MNSRWRSDRIQFSRLLAELRALGLTPEQYAQLGESMDLTRDEIDEVLERAETAWQRIKAEVLTPEPLTITRASYGGPFPGDES